MLRLLKIEWNKIYYYKATRIFTILYFLLLILIGVILAYIKPEIGGFKLDIAKLGMFNFPEIWQNITYLVAIGKIFIAVIIITNITNEYSNGTLKQNLIDGLSKKEFIQSKLLTNLNFALLSTIIVFGITLTLGLIFSQTEDAIYRGMEFIGAYFLKLFYFFTFCMFLSLLLKKSAFAFLGLLVWWMIEGAITTAEVLLRAWLQTGFENIDPDRFYVTNYLPLNVSSKLINFPTMKVEGFIQGGSIFKYSPVQWEFVIAAVIYTAVFIFFSYRLLKKRDL